MRFAVDVGGTFTDLVVEQPDGSLLVRKSPEHAERSRRRACSTCSALAARDRGESLEEPARRGRAADPRHDPRDQRDPDRDGGADRVPHHAGAPRRAAHPRGRARRLQPHRGVAGSVHPAFADVRDPGADRLAGRGRARARRRTDDARSSSRLARPRRRGRRRLLPVVDGQPSARAAGRRAAARAAARTSRSRSRTRSTRRCASTGGPARRRSTRR